MESTIAKGTAITEENRKKAAEEKERGNVCFKLNDFEGAVRHYSESIQCDPTNVVYYLNRAMAYLKLKQYKDVDLDCTQALSLDNKNVKAFWRRGTARRFLGDLKSALNDLQAAAVLAPADQQLKKELTDLEAALSKTSGKAIAKVKAPERRRIPIIEIGEPLGKPNKAAAEHLKEAQPLLTEIKSTKTTDRAPSDGDKPAKTSMKIQEVKSAEKVPAQVHKPATSTSAMAKPTTAAAKLHTSMPVVPTNAVEFERDWKVVRSDTERSVEYLRVGFIIFLSQVNCS